MIWIQILRQKKFIIILMMILFTVMANMVYGRGCNIPYRECSPSSDGSTQSCVWRDRTACRHCKESECTIDKGCLWGGVVGKECFSDQSTGKDPLSSKDEGTLKNQTQVSANPSMNGQGTPVSSSSASAFLSNGPTIVMHDKFQ